MDISQLVSEIGNLKEMVTLIDNTVKFHLQIQWAVLAFVVAAAGAALYFLAKNLVDKKVEQQLEKRFEEMRAVVKNETISHIYENPQFLIYKFNVPVTRFDTIEIGFEDSRNQDFTLDYIDRFQVYSPLSDRNIPFDVNLAENWYTIRLSDYDREEDGDKVYCTIFLLNKSYVKNYIDN